ncbi:MAG TPA: hypothetical protein VD837_07015 [Terriglobales bacterium]|nr:hypothetical protein [Terriglobales bacterium]
MNLNYQIVLTGNTNPFQDAFTLAAQKVTQLEGKLQQANTKLANQAQAMANAGLPVVNGFNRIEQAGNTVTKTLGNTRIAYMQLGSAIPNIASQIAAGGDPIRALAVQIPDALQALTFMGVSLKTLLPIVGAVGLAVGAFAYAWNEATRSQRDAEKATKELGEALKSLPGVLREINTLSKAGLLSPQAVAQYGDYLTGKIPLYKTGTGELSRESSETIRVPRGNTPTMGGPPRTGFDDVTINRKQASPKEVQDWVTLKLGRTGDSNIADSQIESLAGLKEQQDKARREALEGLEKEKAEISAKYEKEREAIQANMTLAGTLLTEKKKAEAEDAIALTRKAEANEIAKKELEYREKATRQAEQERQKLDQVASKMEQRRTKELQGVAEIEKLRNQVYLQTLTGLEREIAAVNLRYDAEKQKIQELIEAKRISADEGERMFTSIELGRQNEITEARAENEKARTAIQKSEKQKQLQIEQDYVTATGSLLGSAADMAKMFGKEGFVAWKAIALAQAVVNGAGAVMLQLGGGDPYSAPIRAAAAAAIAAVQIATIAMAQPGYREGGYTGDGPSDQVAGVVHRGEVVIPAGRVQQFGRRFTEGLARGVIGDIPVPITSQNGPSGAAVRAGLAGGGVGGGSVNVQGHQMSVAFLNDRSEAKQFLATAPGKAMIVDIVKGARIELGMNT